MLVLCGLNFSCATLTSSEIDQDLKMQNSLWPQDVRVLSDSSKTTKTKLPAGPEQWRSYGRPRL